MQLLAKNVFFIGAACWLLYIWATGDNTYLVIAIALFVVTGFLLSRHGRKKQKSKVQNVQVQPTPEVEDKLSKTSAEHQPQARSNYQPNQKVTFDPNQKVTFDISEFDRHISGLQLGAYIGIVVSGLTAFVDEPALNTMCFISFAAIAFTVSDMKKKKDRM